VIVSQSVNSAEKSEACIDSIGNDASKKTKGKNQHDLFETQI